MEAAVRGERRGCRRPIRDLGGRITSAVPASRSPELAARPAGEACASAAASTAIVVARARTGDDCGGHDESWRTGRSRCCTGGIGGVHRGCADSTCRRTSRTRPHAGRVVCAGAKSIIDLPLTSRCSRRTACRSRARAPTRAGFLRAESGLPVDVSATPATRRGSSRRRTRSRRSTACASRCRCGSGRAAGGGSRRDSPGDRRGRSPGRARQADGTPFVMKRVAETNGGEDSARTSRCSSTNARIAGQVAVALARVSNSGTAD